MTGSAPKTAWQLRMGREHVTLLMCYAMGVGIASPLVAQNPKNQTPSKPAVTKFLRRLDRHIGDADPSGYLAHFDPQAQSIHHYSLQARVNHLAKQGVTAKTKLIDFRTQGGVAIALTETTFQRQRKKMSRLQYLAIERRDSKLVARFCIPTTAAAAQGVGRGTSFTCGACNYTLKYGDTWLAVPRIGASDSMESITLVSLTDNVYIETSVHAGDQWIAAEQALQNCVTSQRGSNITKGPPRWAKWRPASLADTPDSKASSIRGTTQCPKGLIADMHLVTTGQLRYLLVVRGPDTALAGARAEIDRVLNSFEILDLRLSGTDLAARIEKIHQVHTGGGTFSAENRYRNSRYGVEIRGPEKWQRQVRAGGWAFKLTFTEPSDAVAPGTEPCRLHTYAYTSGSMDWSRARVEHEYRRLRGKRSSWQRATQGFERLAVKVDDNTIVHFAMRKDLLLVMRATAAKPDVLKRLVAVMESAQSVAKKPR